MTLLYLEFEAYLRVHNVAGGALVGLAANRTDGTLAKQVQAVLATSVHGM